MSNSYVDDIARRIRKVSSPEAAKANEDMPLYRIYAVLLLVKGENVTAKDVHDAWSSWASEYQPDNQNIVPFEELSTSTQYKDEPYARVIRSIADCLKPSQGDDI